jgi:hypothetical protein
MTRLCACGRLYPRADGRCLGNGEPTSHAPAAQPDALHNSPPHGHRKDVDPMVIATLRYTRYARYALAALASIGFRIATN